MVVAGEVRRRLISASLALAAALAVEPASAQATSDTQGPRLDTVQVTGSRLPHADAESPSPIQTITRDDIARSGAASLADVMRQLPANNVFAANENEATRAKGSSGVSLHGLGEGATLVLINGRRVAPFGFAEAFGYGTFVDLNQIPVSAIERVEVLLDGASAIYGSDALGGVVNVILRHDLRGGEVAASFGRSGHGDANQRQASLTWGKGEVGVDGYNAFASYSHSDQDPVGAVARWHSQTADYRAFGLPDNRTSYSYPGNLYTADNRTFLQALTPCALIGGAGSASPGRCLDDLAQQRDIVAGSRRDALFTSATTRLPQGLELFGDAMAGRTEFRSRVFNFSSSSYTTSGTLPSGVITLPVGHPQNPYPFEVALRTRFTDEPRLQVSTSDTQRIVAGVRQHDWAGWDLESALLWSHSNTRVSTSGVIDDRVLLNEVLDARGRSLPTFRFGDPAANDPALMARLYPHPVDHGNTSMISIDLRGRRDLFALPGGAAQLALGAEVRRERFSTAVDPRIASGEITALFGFTSAQARAVASSYAELSLPLARGLEISLAERYDHYSDVGGTANSKAGLKWTAARGLALRGTFATAFRAPSPVETQQASAANSVEVRDPMLCPVISTANPNCDLRVRSVNTGNPDLRPERLRIFTTGLVFEPWRNALFTVDAFRIHRRDLIASINAVYLLDHENDFPGEVVRRGDGTLQQLNLATRNLGASRIWGLDAATKASVPFASGRLGIDGALEWLPHDQQAPTPDQPLVEQAGTNAQPKSRGRLTLSFDSGPWKSALTYSYVGRYLAVKTLSAVCPYADPTVGHPELCTIPSWRTVDLFFGYTGFKPLELGFVINNLDNAQAPFDATQATNVFTTYQSAYHNAIGRHFKLSARTTF